MKQLTNANCAITDQSLHFIDQQVAQLEPYFNQIDDELPIFDIIVEKGKALGTYLGSVTVLLPDASVHAQAENASVDTAIRQAFQHLGDKMKVYEIDRQHKKQTAQRIFYSELMPVSV